MREWAGKIKSLDGGTLTVAQKDSGIRIGKVTNDGKPRVPGGRRQFSRT